MSTILFRSPIAALALLLMASAGAASPFSGLQAQQARPLSFGAIALDGTAGSVLVSPNGYQGCVHLHCLGNAAPGLFIISGTQDYLVQITASQAVLHNDEGATLTVIPSLSTSSLILRSGVGRNSILIGGELRVAAFQPAGPYSGDFELTFEYE